MKICKRTSIVILLFIGFNASVFGNKRDTISLKPLLDFGLVQNNDSKQLIIEGIKKLKSDSFNIGMELLALGIQSQMRDNNSTWIMEYDQLEALSLVRDFGLNVLSPEEEKFRDAIIVEIKSDDFERAVKLIDKGYRKHPNSILIHRMKVLMLWVSQDEDKLQFELNELLKKNNSIISANLLKGQRLMKVEGYEEGLICFSEVIKYAPQYALAFLNRGVCYSQLGSYEMALKDFERAIKLYPNYAAAYNERGDLLSDTKRHIEAEEDYTMALKLNPNNIYYLKDRGNTFYELGRYRRAIIDFETASDIDENYDYAIKRIGDCYYSLHDYEKAIAYYKRALNVDPKYKHALLKLGLCYSYVDDHNSSIETYNKILEIDPKYGSAIGNIGWEFYCVGDYSRCIEYSQKAIRIDIDATYAMFNIALSTLRLGKFEESKKLYKKYVEYCVSSGNEIKEGFKNDLKDVKKQNIMVTEIDYILDNIFP